MVAMINMGVNTVHVTSIAEPQGRNRISTKRSSGPTYLVDSGCSLCFAPSKITSAQ